MSTGTDRQGLAEESPSPGPWKIDWQPIPGRKVHRDFQDLHYVGIKSANYDSVAPHGLSVTGYMRPADAHVLAAAWDLLDAAKRLRRLINDHVSLADVDALDAAIDKAEGRHPADCVCFECICPTEAAMIRDNGDAR